MNTPPLPNATATDLVRWLLRRLGRMRVVGNSMEPTLHAGDVVLIDPTAYRTQPTADLDVVVAEHPQQHGLQIIKRVEFSDDDGVFLRSDNADELDAADSRRFGLVPKKNIVGRVVARVSR